MLTAQQNQTNVISNQLDQVITATNNMANRPPPPVSINGGSLFDAISPNLILKLLDTGVFLQHR
ncbi:hypothetical protein BJI46_12890 [Acinetobacter qingfengensis]|uniref:Uncharacterized protein n=1 Tax=Acinetobacter qingfengensis TaxID=1262585 RepID=A0A1E7R8D3_9GAMM|nr:hypothetical protein BJI46_12890 [Acinetobacter qingfengensis]